jgi:hypothetical protein
MTWLARALIGPTLWAIGFSAVYALHGTGCAQDWTEIDALGTTAHRLAMIAAWLATLAACAVAARRMPPGPGLAGSLPWLGAWIGFGATLFSLLPLVVASSC